MSKKVLHHGLDSYHIGRSLRYEEDKVLDAMTAEIQSKQNIPYREAMRNAIGILDYHDEVSQGNGVGKGTHDRLKQQEREAAALERGVFS